MVEVTCTQPFYDKEAACDRAIGESWEVTEERAAAINSTQYGELVAIGEPATPPAEAPAEAPAETPAEQPAEQPAEAPAEEPEKKTRTKKKDAE